MSKWLICGSFSFPSIVEIERSTQHFWVVKSKPGTNRRRKYPTDVLVPTKEEAERRVARAKTAGAYYAQSIDSARDHWQALLNRQKQAVKAARDGTDSVSCDGPEMLAPSASGAVKVWPAGAPEDPE